MLAGQMAAASITVSLCYEKSFYKIRPVFDARLFCELSNSCENGILKLFNPMPNTCCLSRRV